MTRFFFLITLLSVVALNFSCKKSPTEPTGNLTISVEDVSCTEAWVKITNSNIQNTSALSLFVDDKLNQSITLVSGDTVLYIDSLLPNHSYKLKAIVTTNNHQLTTNELVATTLDTTSHNFTWQTFTFGDNSMLYDVAIINENNIWAVGEIYMKDSLGNQDPTPYNTVHWDGGKWEVKRVTVLFRGNYITPPLYGIFALSEKEIWLSSGVPIRGDGNTWTQYHLFDMGILTQQDGYLTKIWGSSPHDIYYVGTLGTIAHYDGKIWKKIESGTTLSINDIWGSYDNIKKEWEILCIASNQFIDEGKKLLKIVGNRVATLTDNDLSWSLNAIWFETGRKYIIGGDGLYISNTNSAIWKRDYSQPPYYKTAVRGNAINDIFVVGAFGLALHFNGYSWYNYQTTLNLNNGSFGRVEFKDNIVIAVGGQSTKGIISIGRR